jgi:hypothetical protein
MRKLYLAYADMALIQAQQANDRAWKAIGNSRLMISASHNPYYDNDGEYGVVDTALANHWIAVAEWCHRKIRRGDMLRKASA